MPISLSVQMDFVLTYVGSYSEIKTQDCDHQTFAHTERWYWRRICFQTMNELRWWIRTILVSKSGWLVSTSSSRVLFGTAKRHSTTWSLSILSKTNGPRTIYHHDTLDRLSSRKSLRIMIVSVPKFVGSFAWLLRRMPRTISSRSLI